MSRKGRKFELLSKWLNDIDDSCYNVSSPGWVYDKMGGIDREFDVLITYKDEYGITRKKVIECKDWKSTIDINTLDMYGQKKIDCEIDEFILVTTSSFSEAAKNKAKNCGIELETADYFDKIKTPEISETFFIDAYFGKWKFKKIYFNLDSGLIISFKELVDKMNIIEKRCLYRLFNEEILFREEFSYNTVLSKFNKDRKLLGAFIEDENNKLTYNGIIKILESRFSFINKFGINSIYVSADLEITRVNLPLNSYISTFDALEKGNQKKYRAFFGNELCNVEFQFLDKNLVNITGSFKNHNYTFFSFDGKINAIFNKNSIKNFKYNINIAPFDFSEVK